SNAHLERSASLRYLPPFPTRRSSDLCGRERRGGGVHLWCRHGRCEGRHSETTRRGAYRFGSAVRRRRRVYDEPGDRGAVRCHARSEEHTSELQSRENLVCRLLLEKKN